MLGCILSFSGQWLFDVTDGTANVILSTLLYLPMWGDVPPPVALLTPQANWHSLFLLLSIQHIWSLTGRLSFLTFLPFDTKCRHNILGNYIESFKIKGPLTIFKTKINEFDVCYTMKMIFLKKNNKNRQNSFCRNSSRALWQGLVQVLLRYFDPVLILLCFLLFL